MEEPQYRYAYFRDDECRSIGIGKPDVLIIEQCYERNGLTDRDIEYLFRHRPRPRHNGMDRRWCVEKTCRDHGLIYLHQGKWRATDSGLDQVTRVEYRNSRRRWYGIDEDVALVEYRCGNPVTKRHFWDHGIDYINQAVVREKIAVECTDRSTYTPIEYVHAMLIERLHREPMPTDRACEVIADMIDCRIPSCHIIEQCITDGTIRVAEGLLHPMPLGKERAHAARVEAQRRTQILRGYPVTSAITEDFVLKWGSDSWWDDETTEFPGQSYPLQINNRARNRLTRLWRRWTEQGIPPDAVVNRPDST